MGEKTGSSVINKVTPFRSKCVFPKSTCLDILSFAVRYASFETWSQSTCFHFASVTGPGGRWHHSSATTYSVCSKGRELSCGIKILILWMSHVGGQTVLTEID